ncbi:hypothetical protein CDOO_04335 [Corynebacterium doosanense CAU 212 = DSM 45436]|uniref:Uncharacterized protein n=1 Tax=Corynebacterium doosanense CAU 212 = DSM 45436 TaxID=558173 RepID=A0A097IEK3_9CORY|nr:hypothetical protein CDOO_04335 [Corynebacterium doosanense CAU 212 = DSM 45436]
MGSRPRRRVFRPSDAAGYDRRADLPVQEPAAGGEFVELDDDGVDPGHEEEAADRLLRDRPPHWG